MYYSTNYNSPIGELLIISDGECLVEVWFQDEKSKINDEMVQKDDLTIFQNVKQWLDDYFKGKNPQIDFKLKPEGTKFRKKVWKILTEIPYGETKTYGEIASEISPTMSAQAVGGAVGSNPIGIIIPCHRVLGKNGKLTGYSAGLEKKIELLKLENITDFW